MTAPCIREAGLCVLPDYPNAIIIKKFDAASFECTPENGQGGPVRRRSPPLDPVHRRRRHLSLLGKVADGPVERGTRHPDLNCRDHAPTLYANVG